MLESGEGEGRISVFPSGVFAPASCGPQHHDVGDVLVSSKRPSKPNIRAGLFGVRPFPTRPTDDEPVRSRRLAAPLPAGIVQSAPIGGAQQGVHVAGHQMAPKDFVVGLVTAAARRAAYCTLVRSRPLSHVRQPVFWLGGEVRDFAHTSALSRARVLRRGRRCALRTRMQEADGRTDERKTRTAAGRPCLRRIMNSPLAQSSSLRVAIGCDQPTRSNNFNQQQQQQQDCKTNPTK
jgi:hypothetical protein